MYISLCLTYLRIGSLSCKYNYEMAVVVLYRACMTLGRDVIVGI